MAAVLETLPVALTSKQEIWLLSKSGSEITSHDFLFICGMSCNLLYRFAASKGMQMVDQYGFTPLGNDYHQQQSPVMI